MKSRLMVTHSRAERPLRDFANRVEHVGQFDIIVNGGAYAAEAYEVFAIELGHEVAGFAVDVEVAMNFDVEACKR